MNRNFAGNVGTGGANDGGYFAHSDPLLSDKGVAEMLDCGRSTVWLYVA